MTPWQPGNGWTMTDQYNEELHGRQQPAEKHRAHASTRASSAIMLGIPCRTSRNRRSCRLAKKMPDTGVAGGAEYGSGEPTALGQLVAVRFLESCPGDGSPREPSRHLSPEVRIRTTQRPEDIDGQRHARVVLPSHAQTQPSPHEQRGIARHCGEQQSLVRLGSITAPLTLDCPFVRTVYMSEPYTA